MQRGWDYQEYWDGAFPVLAEDRGSVIVCWNSNGLAADQGTWVVMTCPPLEAVEVLAERLSLSHRDSIYHAGARFALASDLAMAGAKVFTSASPFIDVEGLGRIDRPCVPAHEDITPDGHPLSLYTQIPPAPDAKAVWGAELFNYPGQLAQPSTGTISLLGRRRLLFNGPSISLPKGSWTARARFLVDPQRKCDLLIEWGAGTDTETFARIFDDEGEYVLSLSHFWPEAAPADFRASLMMPALDGAFLLYDVTVFAAHQDIGVSAP